MAPSLMVQSVKHGGEVWLGYAASGYTAFAVRKLVLNLQAPAHRMVPPLTFRVTLPPQPDPETPSQANPDTPTPIYITCASTRLLYPIICVWVVFLHVYLQHV